uniref:NACHT domain-containing protein n=1 Tax=Tetraodon nigroviridis TaxID=99883 RepID=H3C6X5_TETNG
HSSEKKPAGSPAPSSVSCTSHRSMDRPVVFKGPASPSPSRVQRRHPVLKDKKNILIFTGMDAQRTSPAESQRHLKSLLKNRFGLVVEGLAGRKDSVLDQVYTELHHTEGWNGEVSTEHEVRQMESAASNANSSHTKIRCEDLFQPLLGRQEPVRSVMTTGIAGIGKTVLTQKFALEWAQGDVSQDIQFLFPVTFRELNLLKGKSSFMGLLSTLFPGTRLETGLEEFRILFILDSLEECRLDLDFQTNEIVSDVTQAASVEVLVTNLIRGHLFPSAHIWI